MNRIRQSSYDRYSEKKRENQNYDLQYLKYNNKNLERKNLSSFHKLKIENENKFIPFNNDKNNTLKSKKTLSLKKFNNEKNTKENFLTTRIFLNLPIVKSPKLSSKKKLFCLSKHFRNKKML